MRETTPEVAPNTKRNFRDKTPALRVLKNPVTKCANSEAQKGK